MYKSYKAKLLVSTIIFGIASYAPQAMSFGLGSFGGLTGGSNTSATTADPEAFIKTAASADALMNSSLTHLVNSLVSKDKSAEMEAAKKAASTITDPKEKQAKELEIDKTMASAVNEALANKDLNNQIKHMDSKKRADLGASAFNFSLALLQDKSLADQSTGLISSLSSNPMEMTKLASVKDVASSVADQISNGVKLASKMPAIFSAVGIKAPVSKDDKEMVTVQTDEQ